MRVEETKPHLSKMCHEKPMNIIKLLNVLRNYQVSINILGSIYTVEHMHTDKTHEGTNNI